jgi:4-oxalocrotonate tautomerase
MEDAAMPQVIVKLWPGKSEEQKSRLAEAIVRDVMEILDYGEDYVSVAMDEVAPADWAQEAYEPDVVANAKRLYKAPGYKM